MAGSSKGFYMKDGRLFESVFFNRGGNQDFGLYADDGTDLGRKFYQGVGHHETGYKRSDGVDIGSLLFDNTEPVQGYITHNIPNNTVEGFWYAPLNGSYSYFATSIDSANFVAHPQRGSGIYSYNWSAWNTTGFDYDPMPVGKPKQVITTTASTLSLPCPLMWSKDTGGYGLNIPYGTAWKYGEGTTVPCFCCTIRDGITNTTASPTVTITTTWTCEYCMYNCSDCD